MGANRDERGHARLRRMGWEPAEGQRSLRRLPSLLRSAFAMTWEAAPRLLLAFLALDVVGAAGTAASLLVVRGLVTALLAANQSHAGLGSIAVPLVALAVVMSVIGLAQSLRQGITMLLQERISWIASERILDIASAVELEAFDHSDFHDRLQRAQQAGMNRPFQLTQSMLAITNSLTTLAGMVAVLFILQPLLIPTLLLTVVPLLAASSMFSRDFYSFFFRFAHDERRRQYIRGLMTERGMAKEVRAFGLTEYLRGINRRLFEERLEDLNRLVSRGSFRSLAGSFGAALATAATVAVLLGFVLTGHMSLGAATAAAVAIVQLGGTLSQLAFGANQIYESSLFLEDYRDFCAMLPTIVNEKPAGEPPAGFDAIHVDRVTFTYPESERPALEDVSLTIRRGEVVALVGENGSGKTTLAKLLSQLYQPQSGRICWDGHDLAEVDAARLRGSVAVLFQDFAHYLFDAATNIGMGRVERRDDQSGIEQAARHAGAHEFLSELSDGYATMLGKIFEGGVDLSIGQWQRVALARAFFRDAPLIILDEPTAALDARREHELFASMRDLMGGRTVLLISHRFSSVLSADRIYVLRQGRLIEQGTHAELMRQDGHYAELFRLQASAYVS